MRHDSRRGRGRGAGIVRDATVALIAVVVALIDLRSDIDGAGAGRAVTDAGIPQHFIAGLSARQAWNRQQASNQNDGHDRRYTHIDLPI